VRDDEREAVLSVLREEGVAFSYEPDLDPAVRRALEGSGEGDLVLLLGAQGMDRAAEVAKAVLGRM
jgi:UDP-N-acetylmuramoyl-L-alanyl-D-glutamate--2,6-diaminopimelate ligase